MKNYQVIAKRFRPKKFIEVFEQDAIVQTLKNAIRMDRIGNAYLFCGMRGTGKTTLARLLAKAINCENLLEDQEPCNQCPSCKEISAGHSLDVIEIDGASNRGIDDIRNLNETVGYAASNGRYKVYIIDEVHMLTKEAFNALLKTLEEPPNHVVFFFATTEAHKVLPTIISRCQRFDLKRITSEKIQMKLQTVTEKLSIQVEEEALQLIADHSEGSLRDAESLLDQLICYESPPITKDHAIKSLGLVPLELFLELDEAVGNAHLPFAFEFTEKIFQMGCHLQHFLESLTEHIRNIALIHMGKKGGAQYTRSAQFYTREQCLSILDYLLEMQEKMQKSPFKRIHFEILLLHILRSKQKISIENLVDRLERLKESPSPSKPLESEKPEKMDVEPPSLSPPATSQDNAEIPKSSSQVDPIPPKQENAAEEVPFVPPQKQPLDKESPSPSKPLESEKPEKMDVEPTATSQENVEVPKPSSQVDPIPQKQESTVEEVPFFPSSQKESLPKIEPTNIQKKIKHERIIRFTSVELNGSIR